MTLLVIVIIVALIIAVLYFMRKPKLEKTLNSTDTHSQKSEENDNPKDAHNQKLEEIRNTTDEHKLRKLLINYSNGFLAFTRAGNYTKGNSYIEFPNYQYIREIGEQAYKVGGINLMRKICRNENGGYFSDSWSDFFWQGLHGWQA